MRTSILILLTLVNHSLLNLTRNNDAEPNYKYVEVVRKKDERAKLNGYKCRDCQEVTC